MQEIRIRDRLIGKDQSCFITVDIGANHNRSIEIAKRLINKAAEAEADAIKFQVYSAETLYSKNTPKHSRFKKDVWKLVKDIEMSRDWIPQLKEHCDKRAILFFATPFDIQAVDELEPHVDFYKIGSFELMDLPFLQHVAAKKKPIVISTGLATMEELEEAYSTCTRTANDKIAFLQCVSTYPAKPRIMNLRAMETIRQRFDVPVGLSDHTKGIHVSVAAVAMGACVVEKHFTLDRNMKGPDHSFAIEPDELREMVRQIREVESALGDGKKNGPEPEEKENYRLGRRSIHARVDIAKGTKIRKEMLVTKRPSFGIEPKFMDVVVGKEAQRDIEADEWITWEAVAAE